MPFVEGESLRDRLDREHQLPVDEAVAIATKVAGALQAAHDHGVIHRDIKPANILLSKGEPVVSDFGIALAVSAGGAGRLTETGLSLGTPHYMSPEQATGDASVGPATDVYALRCVLYEMLAGEPPYTGSTPQAILGKIIQAEPVSATKSRRSVPPNVDAAIRKALEKVPADRFGSATELARALDEAAFRHGDAAASAAPRGAGSWNRLTVAFSGATVVLGLALGWTVVRPSSSTPGVATERTSLLLPAGRPIDTNCFPCGSLAISPDGQDVVYVADAGRRALGGRILAIRSLSTRSVRELPGTEDAGQPFFSPDGRWVAFFTDDALKKVPLAGGDPLTLAENVTGARWGFGTWTDDDEIVFGSTFGGGLRRVSAEGGALESLTTVDAQGELYHLYPDFLPGTRTVLFTVFREATNERRIEAANLDTGERREVIDHGGQPQYMSGGTLVYVRDGNLVSVPFDPDRIVPTGPVVPIGDEVRSDGGGSIGYGLQVSVARSGTMAYVPPAASGGARMGIVSRDGAFEAFGPAVSASDVHPRVSPDGRTVAFTDGALADQQVYVHDLARGSTDRLTQRGRNLGAEWHPSGTALAIFSYGDRDRGVYLRDLSGSERLLLPVRDGFARNMAWSPDGSALAYTLQIGNEHHIWTISADDSSSARPLIEGPSQYQASPRFSPDGRWLAYVSNESGRDEVYVRRYPEGARLRVSTEGATGAMWSRDGSELFFEGLVDDAPTLMAVSVAEEGEMLSLGTPTPLFELQARDADGVLYRYDRSGNVGPDFDVFPDGRRFVVVRRAVSYLEEIVLVQNLALELQGAASK